MRLCKQIISFEAAAIGNRLRGEPPAGGGGGEGGGEISSGAARGEGHRSCTERIWRKNFGLLDDLAYYGSANKIRNNKSISFRKATPYPVVSWIQIKS